jgi:DNA-binding NarL/FixJ family response regulator
MRTSVEATNSKQSSSHAMETRRLRIVVADGSPQHMAVVLAVLEFHELVDLIGRSANFEETIELVVNHQPDLVLIDLEMPLASLAIPAIILSTRASIRILGMCSGEASSRESLDVLTSLNALLHKSRLRQEFLPVVEALYSGTATLNPISSPKDLDEDLGPDCFWQNSKTTH